MYVQGKFQLLNSVLLSFFRRSRCSAHVTRSGTVSLGCCHCCYCWRSVWACASPVASRSSRARAAGTVATSACHWTNTATDAATVPTAATSPSIVQVSLLTRISFIYYYMYICLPRTVCNRTYYGDIGRTYAIKVPTPQWNKLPFLCHLTFTASGHDQGDIVQVSRPTHMHTAQGRRGKRGCCVHSVKRDGRAMSVSPLRRPRAVVQLE